MKTENNLASSGGFFHRKKEAKDQTIKFLNLLHRGQQVPKTPEAQPKTSHSLSSSLHLGNKGKKHDGLFPAPLPSAVLTSDTVQSPEVLEVPSNTPLTITPTIFVSSDPEEEEIEPEYAGASRIDRNPLSNSGQEALNSIALGVPTRLSSSIGTPKQPRQSLVARLGTWPRRFGSSSSVLDRTPSQDSISPCGSPRLSLDIDNTKTWGVSSDVLSTKPNSSTNTPSRSPWRSRRPQFEMPSDDAEPLPEEFTENPFANISNFRDVGHNYNMDILKSLQKDVRRLREGRLLRSGRLDQATDPELDLLENKYNIKSVIDLRAETEGTMGEVLINTFPTSMIKGAMCPVATKTAIDEHLEQLKEEGKTRRRRVKYRRQLKAINAHHQENPRNPRCTYFVNFAGTNYRIHCVLNPLSFSHKCKIVSLMTQRRKPEAIQLVGKTVLEPQGLTGLYKGFIDYCGEEIVTALKIMAMPDNYPILVHCTQGKDRTGLVCAMALWCCGLSEDYIVMDYARSQKGLDTHRTEMVEEMARTGLSPVFSDAPAYIMRRSFAYIKWKYGGVQEYLELHGLVKGFRQGIANCLLEPEKRRDV